VITTLNLKKEDHKDAQEFSYDYFRHQAENSFYSNENE
jgi:hypothetical protein